MANYKIDRGVLIPKTKIHPNPWNPNHMTDREQAAIEESITTYGQVIELLVRPRPDIPDEFQIIDGEHRYNALPNEVYCNVIYGLPDSEAKKLTIVMNETRGSADKIELAQLLSDLQSEIGEDLGTGLPYSQEELDELVRLAGVEWDQFDEKEDFFSDDSQYGDLQSILIKVSNQDLDVLKQAFDLVKDETGKSFPKKEDFAWGLVFLKVAKSFLSY